MKKCASCTKDLPDAALHCVFCGAKQPPAPAVQQGLAKTAFGYSANDALDQARRQARPPAPPAASYSPPRVAPGPMPAMPAASSPTILAPPRPTPPSSPPSVGQAASPPYRAPAAPAPAPAGAVPVSSAGAATMFVPGPAAPPGSGYPRPGAPGPASAPTFVQTAAQATAIPARAPNRPQPPIMAIPAAQPPPYMTSQTSSRVIRPIEPWRDGLRAMMFLWGVALLAAFATPLATSPALQFHWNAILDGAGIARLPPLLLGAIGLLSVVVSVIPMPVSPRGLLAACLGIAGIAVPIALVGVPPWQALATMAGALVLIPGLLVRSEYRDAMTPRILVTLGAAGILAPFFVPQEGAIPLVSGVKLLIDVPGAQKVEPALALGMITIVVMSLLAWLPAPVTGAAKLWAWLLILWALVAHAIHLALAGGIPDAITGAPNATLVGWVAAGEAGALGSAYLVLVGYGLAAVVGKRLE